MNTKYCLDTNIFIVPWKKFYSPDFTYRYLELIEKLAKKNVIFTTMAVKEELEKKDDDIFKWVKKMNLFKEIDESVQKKLVKLSTNIKN